ncbi:MAG: T9SS type A sorting domain-containing protein, partial [Bacteroidetes bacterium]|nr:T9SS type A sorting domain-containing protein [Bacteroidota bacterium]MBU1720819.1 T9SS type A sorting domain-containing protein [Bacteroidota bacterium]
FYNPESKSFQLSLTDASGRLVRSAVNITGNELTINRKDLSAGVYLMELKSESRVFRGKIIVE